MVAPKTWPEWDLRALEIDWVELELTLEENRRLREREAQRIAAAEASTKITQWTRWCPYCGTRYELPSEGWKQERVEATCDIRPPARVAIWAVDHGDRLPKWSEDPIIHACKRGVPCDPSEL